MNKIADWLGSSRGPVAAALVALSIFLTPTWAVLAAPRTTIVVNTLADDGIGNGNCTLREAIAAANTNLVVDACAAGSSGLDTIGFSVSGTVTLLDTLPAVDEDLVIYAPPNALIISGNNSYLILIVNSGKTLDLLNLAIKNGSSSGGGGGVFNQGTLNITETTFTGNNATAGSYGGAINNSGTVNITNSSFYSNSASQGGAIYNVGAVMNITNGTFGSNVAGSGGAIYNENSILNVFNSTFVGNTISYGFGGGIASNGSGSVLKITGSTFSANTALGASGTNGGGGLFSYGAANILNSTFSANTATVYGGGIWNLTGIMTITNSTLSGNGAAGGAISHTSGYTMTLLNTIVANSTSGGNCYMPITPIVNGGNNIDDGTSCGWGSTSGSMSSTNPMLGPLANNGGPTLTHALLRGSPAANAANVLNCPAADQRGVYRLADGLCSIGAYEEIHKYLFLPIIVK